ncbi:MAG: NAD(+) synthase [Clostridia bacterium]|nr:NAD(+) synthase [Clostridia bacterium]MBQ7897821.1 NAD(+) synthase [Clostridia bacterium]
MRNWKIELEKRCEYIRRLVENAHAKGVVFGNSGGKDSALVGILARHALPKDYRVLGLILPCESKINFTTDKDDADALAEKFGIEKRVIDLTDAKKEIVGRVSEASTLNSVAINNIAPRLRMTTLYTVGAAESLLIAGTGNRCERFMGYFTKWGDGAFDFNPIADLYVSEVYDFLRYLGCPESIINKAPSAGLFEGQTDEKEMGVTYAEVESYIRGEEVAPASREIIERYHARSAHKRGMAELFEKESD